MVAFGYARSFACKRQAIAFRYHSFGSGFERFPEPGPRFFYNRAFVMKNKKCRRSCNCKDRQYDVYDIAHTDNQCSHEHREYHDGYSQIYVSNGFPRVRIGMDTDERRNNKNHEHDLHHVERFPCALISSN